MIDIKTILTRIILVVNGLLFVFSAIIVGGASYSIYNYDENFSEFLEKRDYALFLLGGLIGMIISVAACCGARSPKEYYRSLFCYFFFLSIVLIVNITSFYFYRVFVKNLQASADGEVEQAVQESASKEFQDFLLSTYTVCCSGCLTAVDALCTSDVSNSFTVANCGNQTTTCDYAELCADGLENDGLGAGCFINALTIPPYEVLLDVCQALVDVGRDSDGTAVVGPVDSGACGGGSPAEFITQSFEWLSNNYTLIAVSWGFGISIAIIAWFGAFLILLCPSEYTG